MRMQLEVYPTDAETFEAAAALVAERLRERKDRATVALSGGRTGRGVMVGLAARDDVPWERIEWFWGDERCVPPDDPRSNVRLARESLLAPRHIPAERIHPPPLDLAVPERIAAAYAATLIALLAPGPAPVFDLVLLGVGRDAHVASLMPGSAAIRATAPVAAVRQEEVSEEPVVPRMTITPPVLAAARHVVVVVAGAEKAAAVAAAMREPVDPVRVPAQLVRPSPRVTWLVDRAAAAELLRDARPAG
jgi:6-phosphogluconolactonase